MALKQTHKKCIEEYKKEVVRQTSLYEQWIAENENPAKLGKIHSVKREGNFALFTTENGELAEGAFDKIAEAFQNKETMLLYGDEDVMEPETLTRREPWFKPCWSPDTLATYFYMGNYVAIRREILEKVLPIYYDDKVYTMYEIVVKTVNYLWEKKTDLRKAIVHIDEILYHAYEETEILGYGTEYDKIKEQLLYKKSKQTGIDILLREKGEPKISIIIPSKDNPKVLQTAVSSICEKTFYTNFEIIVVDNGSNEENRSIIEKMKIKYGFNYMYEPMDFNFSAMCNMGVEKASGEYLLLLNDDCEVVQENWLLLMLEQAKLPHVGAVGAKLYFPEGDKIQHAGVVNLEVGPAHKLSGLSDAEIIYHGVNRGVINMLAVTAACLMVKREKYLQAGGLCKELQVAYNDVDFCFTLYEQGYYNVQRNDVVLYHHESLSRGNDMLEESKYERLLREKKKLYERHPVFAGKDPFYSRHLITDSIFYYCNFHYDYEKHDVALQPDRKRMFRLPTRNKIHPFYFMDYAGKERKLEIDEETSYRIEGWCFFKDVDNACYKTYVLLENEKKQAWRFPVMPRYRTDVNDITPNQIHIELSGFVVRFKKDEIPAGTYRIILMKKEIGTIWRQYVETEQTIEIE